uniref:Uncharacterized protein n=1 Tax=mine drainage metagenome TaxID=410659 RepID=E6PN73_9ZZZZ
MGRGRLLPYRVGEVGRGELCAPLCVCRPFWKSQYSLADHKEQVIDLLARVTTVSLETLRIVQAMRAAAR